MTEPASGHAERLLALLERRTGIVVAEPAQRLRLFALGEKLGRAHPQGPLGLLQSLEAGEEPMPAWGQLLELVANRQTSFFRDREQFLVLGSWLEARARELDRPLRLWSAACSTGEEAYSLAMLCADRGLSAEVLGTDLQPRNLAHAVRGRYRTWALRNLTPAQRARDFSSDGPEEAQLGEALRRQVTFRRHNLLESPQSAAPGRWDLVMLCNVLIYFARPRAEQVLRTLAGALDDQGVLVLGASEGMLGMRVPLQPRQFRGRVHYIAAAVEQSPSEERPVPTPTPPALLPPLPDAPPVARRPEPPEVPAPAPLAAEVLRILSEGHQHTLAHRFDAALDAYQRAVRLAPELAEGYLFQGWILRKLGQLEAAREALRSALFLDPGLWPAAYLLAGVHQRLGDREGQLRECRRTLALTEPGRPGPTLLTPEALLEALLPRAAQAREAARALAETPQSRSIK